MLLLHSQIHQLTADCQALRDAAAAGSAAAAEEGRAAAALDTRQAQLVGRCEDLGRRIRELGSLSAEVFEKYQGKGQKVRSEASAGPISRHSQGCRCTNCSRVDQQHSYESLS